MAKVTINIAGGDYTASLQKRQIGKINVGFYCDQCHEFVAVAVADREDKKNLENTQYACTGPIEFACPFCRHHQKRIVTELQTLILTEGNKRK